MARAAAWVVAGLGCSRRRGGIRGMGMVVGRLCSFSVIGVRLKIAAKTSSM